MTLQVSTGFKNLFLAAWPGIFDRGVIAIYSGTRPATADDAVTGTLLGIITQNGYPWAVGDDASGLFYAQSGPYIIKPLGIEWACTVAVQGVATWFRVLTKDQDPGTKNYDWPRVDGDISEDATSGAELILPETNLLVNDYVPLDSFFYTIPPIVT